METEPHPHPKIQSILAHSYYSFFLFFVVGVILDMIFSVRIFDTSFARPFGFIMILLGSVVVLWAQRHSIPSPASVTDASHLCRGPYCYTRNPTHWGLVLLTLGFGVIANAFFVVLLTVLSFVISKFWILRKHDVVLREHYGQAYTDYKKKVKF